MSNNPNNVRYEWISPHLIALNWNINPRAMDEKHIQDIAFHMNAQGYNPNYPIIIYQLSDNADPKSVGIAATGYHRLMASQFSGAEFPNLPLEKVYCEIRQGTMDDVIRTMLEDNLKWTPGMNAELGKMPSLAEIRTIRYRLMLFPDVFCKSDSWLAKDWNCDHKTVAGIRDKIIEELPTWETSQVPYFTDETREEILGIIESDMYLGLDGKERPRAPMAKPQQAQTVDQPLPNFDLMNPDPEPDIDEIVSEYTADYSDIIENCIKDEEFIEGYFELESPVSYLIDDQYKHEIIKARGVVVWESEKEEFFHKVLSAFIIQANPIYISALQRLQALQPNEPSPVGDVGVSSVHPPIHDGQAIGDIGTTSISVERTTQTVETEKVEIHHRHPPINISVPPRTYEKLKVMADDHDIVSQTENPKITTTARDFLIFLCTLNDLPGIEKPKEKGLTLKEIIRQGVGMVIDRN